MDTSAILLFAQCFPMFGVYENTPAYVHKCVVGIKYAISLWVISVPL